MGRKSILKNIQKITNLDGFIPIKKMAEMEGKTVQTIYYRVREGKYEAVDLGGLILIRSIPKPTKMEQKIKSKLKQER